MWTTRLIPIVHVIVFKLVYSAENSRWWEKRFHRLELFCCTAVLLYWLHCHYLTTCNSCCLFSRVWPGAGAARRSAVANPVNNSTRQRNFSKLKRGNPWNWLSFSFNRFIQILSFSGSGYWFGGGGYCHGWIDDLLPPKKKGIEQCRNIGSICEEERLKKYLWECGI